MRYKVLIGFTKLIVVDNKIKPLYMPAGTIIESFGCTTEYDNKKLFEKVDDSEYNEQDELDKLLEEYKHDGMEVSYIETLPNGFQIPHYKPKELK